MQGGIMWELLGYLVLSVLIIYIVCRLGGAAAARSFFEEKRRYQQQGKSQDKEG